MSNFVAQELRDTLESNGNSFGANYTPANYRDYLKTLALIQIAEELQTISSHIPSILKALEYIDDDLHAGLGVESGEAVTAKLIPGGMQMSTSAPGASQITVDTANSNVTLAFYDDKGDVAEAPAGVSVAFATDTPTVLTVQADATNPLQGDLTPVAEGSANISATISGANAPDGSPFSVSPVAVNVVAGAAESAGLSLEVPSQS